MARKCSSCGNNGHNSRTCSGHGRTTVFENGFGGGGGGGGGGVRLFGVQLHVAGSSPMAMKKCFSMECLSSSTLSSAVTPTYYATALAATTNSNSPSASSSSSLVSVEENPEKMTNGYLSDGLMGRAQERKKGVPWTEDEHRRFLAGLEKLGKGDWRGISRHFVTTRTPTQVASHAQKYFLRQSSLTHKKRRSSLFDVVENADRAATSSITDREQRLRLKDAAIATTASAAAPGTTPTPTELPALSLGIISRPARRPEHVVLPPTSLSLQLPRCSAAMGSLALAAPKHTHPSSTLTPAATASSSQALPDLELKISIARPQSDVHQVQTGSSPSPPPRTPFLGTIRVT